MGVEFRCWDRDRRGVEGILEKQAKESSGSWEWRAISHPSGWLHRRAGQHSLVTSLRVTVGPAQVNASDSSAPSAGVFVGVPTALLTSACALLECMFLCWVGERGCGSWLCKPVQHGEMEPRKDVLSRTQTLLRGKKVRVHVYVGISVYINRMLPMCLGTA